MQDKCKGIEGFENGRSMRLLNDPPSLEALSGDKVALTSSAEVEENLSLLRSR